MDFPAFPQGQKRRKKQIKRHPGRLFLAKGESQWGEADSLSPELKNFSRMDEPQGIGQVGLTFFFLVCLVKLNVIPQCF